MNTTAGKELYSPLTASKSSATPGRAKPLRGLALLALAAAMALPGCNSSSGASSTMGRSAVSLAQESRGQQYALGPQFENQLGEMISQEVQALGVKENLPMELNREVLLNINYYLNDARSFMTKGLSRGSKYIPMMKAIFRQKGLPEDLVYLALIESGFKTDAVSHASAVGPWQFIGSTGRRYGLTINDWVDERRDPVKSTYAAADYLTALHDIFNSWPLAIAAYNSGEGKILKGMKNYGVNNFWDMSNVRDHLAGETKLYVPSFLAAAFIAKDPAAYGLEFEVQKPDQWEDVVVPAAITLEDAAKFSGATVERLKELNPQLKKEATPPDEVDFVLRVPTGSGDKFAKAYQKSGRGAIVASTDGAGRAVAKAASSSKPTLSTLTHKVKAGDTLSTIAKRYGVSVESVQKANNLSSTTVREGQILKIQSDLPLTAQKKSSSQLMVVTTQAVPRKTSTHTVAAGETMGSIARKYNMSVKELADINQIKDTTIKVGQKLKVLGQGTEIKSGAVRPGVKAAGTHTVAEGETVGHIAQKYGITSKELMALNDMTSANIRVGQKLKVPAASGGGASAKPAAANQSAAPKASSSRVHIVAEGETVGHIAQKYGLTSKELMALNSLSDANIRVGQKLKLPASSGSGASSSSSSSASSGTAASASSGVHVVASGENIGVIARKYGLSPKDLMALNNMSDPVIKVGQKLKVSGKPSTGASSAGTSSTGSYKVLEGDTLSSIAKKHGTTIESLKKLNSFTDSTVLRPGRSIKIK